MFYIVERWRDVSRIAAGPEWRYSDGTMRATTFIPKTGVETAKRRLYDKAYTKANRREPALSWSNWIRRALDTAARDELKLKGCPHCTGMRDRPA